MSLLGGSARMNNARKDLVVAWEQTRQRWNDPNSRRLEKQYLQPWDRDARQAARAMTELSVLVQKLRRDCE